MSQDIEYTSRIDYERRMNAEAIAEREGQRTYWQALQGLAANLSGKLLLPGNPDYEVGRTVWSGVVNRHPALIVRCMDASDVIASVTFAREQDLPVSVRSGGHNAAGYGSSAGSLLLKGGILRECLRRMDAVLAGNSTGKT